MTDCNRMQKSAARSSRTRRATALLAVSALALTACGNSANSGKAPTTLTIGISLSLTGDFADSGKSAERGYQLWANTVNAKGGVLNRKVQLKIVDDASSPNQVVSNYQNLITRDHVDLVFGPFSSLLTLPSSAVVNRYKYASSSRPAADPRSSRRTCTTCSSCSPPPRCRAAWSSPTTSSRWPASQRPKTAAYPSLDDPFASPIADAIRKTLRGGRDQDRLQRGLSRRDHRPDSDHRQCGRGQPGHRRRRDPVPGRLRRRAGHDPAQVGTQSGCICPTVRTTR